MITLSSFEYVRSAVWTAAEALDALVTHARSEDSVILPELWFDRTAWLPELLRRSDPSEQMLKVAFAQLRKDRLQATGERLRAFINAYVGLHVLMQVAVSDLLTAVHPPGFTGAGMEWPTPVFG